MAFPIITTLIAATLLAIAIVTGTSPVPF